MSEDFPAIISAILDARCEDCAERPSQRCHQAWYCKHHFLIHRQMRHA